MSVGYQIKEVLEQIMWMGVAFGIVGYFIYREWGRRRESMTMLERMTPEQLADIRRVDAEIEIERQRRRQPLVPAGRHGGLWRGIGRLYWIGNNEKQSFASLRHKQRYSRLSDNSTYRVDDGTVYLLRISDRAQAPAFGRASLLGRTEINRILIFSGTEKMHPRFPCREPTVGGQ